MQVFPYLYDDNSVSFGVRDERSGVVVASGLRTFAEAAEARDDLIAEAAARAAPRPTHYPSSNGRTI